MHDAITFLQYYRMALGASKAEARAMARLLVKAGALTPSQGGHING